MKLNAISYKTKSAVDYIALDIAVNYIGDIVELVPLVYEVRIYLYS